ncbi:Rieske 2Fe-2S domain-containing protein [Actinocorallia sp. A-T 12471]|uniref:Rieske 2Fe-2S domain-containing protein n=1 Tax=Actinocorallia sp. A-T 12471 TaxID=3089813 RepID=UPI0029CE4232|nr:Rieske 2Fe-2S domain-containing protein [Actinocorallia sp. A-T 12471]MDX6740620.1 Rieske 2Fe-2S domain-containing protein [Actinocorallia sp. A-T 12471]
MPATNAPLSTPHPQDRWDVLTRTGSGTPAGDLLRRYWQPIMLSKDFGQDAPPEPIGVLGEKLVLFRDDKGALGLLDQRCPHRNADLSYGRVEDGGLRCPYHGWLFDGSGACLEQPNVPAAQRTEVQWRTPAYPVCERGGLIWAYLGPGEPPVMPRYPFLDAPEGHVFTNRWLSECNYQQANEGNIDPSHTSFVHRMEVPGADETMSGFKADTAPRLRVVDTSYGFRLLAERDDAARAQTFLRCSNFILPNAASANGFEAGLGIGGASMLWHVPVDDNTHYRYEVTFHATTPLPVGPLEDSVAEEMDGGRRRRTLANRFLQDREEMKERTFAGVGTAFPVHDLLVTESMGPITDRRNEHLTPSDLGIMRARRLMLRAVEDVAAGKEPQGVCHTEQEAAFEEFVTFSDWLTPGADAAEHAAEMAARGIYRIPSAQ